MLPPVLFLSTARKSPCGSAKPIIGTPIGFFFGTAGASVICKLPSSLMASMFVSVSLSLSTFSKRATASEATRDGAVLFFLRILRFPGDSSGMLVSTGVSSDVGVSCTSSSCDCCGLTSSGSSAFVSDCSSVVSCSANSSVSGGSGFFTFGGGTGGRRFAFGFERTCPRLFCIAAKSIFGVGGSSSKTSLISSTCSSSLSSFCCCSSTSMDKS
mmetsp:Transcript_9357/g.34663  ORF Transcript_9357/g.34663 Transcript_9357/m.34663 type:complete len:213 (-) Transcript_9357:1231-1869(-)